MSNSLILTLVFLVVEIGLFLVCLKQARKPVDPLRPRMLPYNVIMLLLAVAILATLAHVISLMTGHQLMPRRGKAIR